MNTSNEAFEIFSSDGPATTLARALLNGRPNMKAFTSVPKVTGPTAARFHAEYLLPERPVLIAGACASRAYDLWSPEYFCRIAPDLEVPTTGHIRPRTLHVVRY